MGEGLALHTANPDSVLSLIRFPYSHQGSHVSTELGIDPEHCCSDANTRGEKISKVNVDCNGEYFLNENYHSCF